MARCPHCGETMADGQEHCYACGQHHRARAFRHEHHVNPLIYIGAGLVVVLVLGVLGLNRSNAARKQARLLAEQETLRVQDSVRRASHQWQDMVQVAKDDPESQSLNAELDDIESRFESVRTRVASHPSPRQESIIGLMEHGLAALRQSTIVLASSAETDKQIVRDSIQAGMRGVEDLTEELGTTE